MRTVIVASPAANKAKKIENFTGTTWGDLKAHPTVQELTVGNVEAIVNPGNQTLSRQDAVLPTSDFKLFLVPTKNKAGNETPAAVAQQVEETIVRASQLAQVQDMKNLRERLNQTVADFYHVDVAAIAAGEATTGNQELDTALSEAHSL